MQVIEAAIVQKLDKALSPNFLEVINESASHNVPPGSESHFKVIVCSDYFLEMSAVKRHQVVYSLLSEELSGAVHALSIFAHTVEERGQIETIPASPNCMGGKK